MSKPIREKNQRHRGLVQQCLPHMTVGPTALYRPNTLLYYKHEEYPSFVYNLWFENVFLVVCASAFENCTNLFYVNICHIALRQNTCPIVT